MRLKYLKTLLVVTVLLVSFAGTSTAAEYWLRAEAFVKTMPDATNITMWGYALVQYDIGAGVVAGDNVLKVPGPTLTVPPGQGLTIHLTNNLTVPTSVVIPGQIPTLTPGTWPTWTDGTTGARTNLNQRVRSLTHETNPATTVDYVWTNIKPGTYLYHTGTQQQVQVQMGLYGAMKNDFAAGQAYTGVNYTKDVILLFSEIDPVLHNAIATGTYGTPPAPTSMINYLPKYFLLNGEAYSSSTTPPILAGNSGQNILLRFLNAGLKDYVPVLQGMHFSLLAEDGNLLPFPRSQYSLLLPAGKTMDARIPFVVGRKLPLYDRRLSLTNNVTSPGGIFNYLLKGEPIVDFDGDVGSDISIYRVSTGEWLINPSLTGTPYGIGFGGDPSDKPVPADYDGDGKTDIAIYRSGSWFIIPSSTGVAYGIGFGGDASDKPVPADYDGDGKTDIAIYRSGSWFIIPSSTEVAYGIGFGGDASDKPVPADYDGDGKTDIAIYRSGSWFIIPSSTGVAYGIGFGGDASDKPVPADYDGDGKTDIAIYRSGSWFIIPSSTGVAYGIGFGGDASDKPVPADYDRDGKTDVAVYRATNGSWFVLPSSSGTPYGVSWGGDPNDIPLTTIWALY
jgi:hypothetical protein